MKRSMESYNGLKRKVTAFKSITTFISYFSFCLSIKL